jgi:excisionase family DNA binding protein
METAEFTFTSELPQRKTRKGFFSGIKSFFEETGGGAIPVPLAAKMVKRDPMTIHRWVEKGKLRAFRSGKTTLVNIHDLEKLLDEKPDVGGRPRKAS